MSTRFRAVLLICFVGLSSSSFAWEKDLGFGFGGPRARHRDSDRSIRIVCVCNEFIANADGNFSSQAKAQWHRELTPSAQYVTDLKERATARNFPRDSRGKVEPTLRTDMVDASEFPLTDGAFTDENGRLTRVTSAEIFRDAFTRHCRSSNGSILNTNLSGCSTVVINPKQLD